MTELYRIEGTFRYEGEKYECDVRSHGTLEVCTVPGAPEECDVDLEYVELENCIEWDEDWHSIDECDVPEDIVEDIEGTAFVHLLAGDYKEVYLIGTGE